MRISTKLTATIILGALTVFPAQAQETGSTVVYENDRGAATSVDRTYDQETRTYSTHRSTVTRDGDVSTSEGSISCDGAGNCVRTGGYTGPQGRSGASETIGQVREDGSYTGVTTSTRPNGEIVTRERNSFGERGNRSGDVVISGPNGQATQVFNRSYDQENGYQRNTQTVGPNGRVFNEQANVVCDSGSCERQVISTGPEGRQRVVRNNGARTGPGEFQGEREVTNRNGETRSSRRWVRVERSRRKR